MSTISTNKLKDIKLKKKCQCDQYLNKGPINFVTFNNVIMHHCASILYHEIAAQ